MKKSCLSLSHLIQQLGGTFQCKLVESLLFYIYDQKTQKGRVTCYLLPVTLESGNWNPAFMHESLHWYIHSSIHLSSHVTILSFVHLSLCLCIHPCMHMCVSLFIHPSIHPCIQQYVNVSCVPGAVLTNAGVTVHQKRKISKLKIRIECAKCHDSDEHRVEHVLLYHKSSKTSLKKWA